MTILKTDPLDWKLNAAGDFDFSSGGPVFVSGVPGVAQLIQIAVSFVMGEWFANLGIGIPLLPNATVPESNALLGQRFSMVKARTAYRTAILAVPGVASVKVDASFTARTRTLTVSWVAVTTFGDTVADSLVQNG